MFNDKQLLTQSIQSEHAGDKLSVSIDIIQQYDGKVIKVGIDWTLIQNDDITSNKCDSALCEE